MSARSPFRGKWTCRDDADDTTLRLDGTLGAGTKILLYKVGTLSSYDYVVCALQSDTATPTKPSGLDDCYLSPVPYSGGAYKANGVGSTADRAQQKAAKFLFRDGVPPYFVAYDGPPNSEFGLWAYITGGKFWGWTVASPKPAKYSYTAEVSAPSAAHARSYLGGVCPPGCDYTWADLTDEDYSGLTMVGARFAGADLTRVSFTGGELPTADFRNVHSVSGADLTGMNLAGALFAGADLSAMDFTGSDLTGADFRGVKSMAGAIFSNTILTGARFEGADLTGAKFTGTDLRGVRLDGANLTGASFLDGPDRPADLTGVDFSVATSVRGARFGTGLVGAGFAGLDLTGTDFSGAVMKGTNFSRCDLRPALFSPTPTFSDDANYRTNLSQAIVEFEQLGKNWSFMNLVQTEILGIPEDLSRLNAQSSLLRGWVLSNHNLAGAILSNADLSGATLSYCNLTGARLDYVQFQIYEATGRAAVLSGSQMENADLTGANLTGASLSGVYLWGQSATISKATVRETDFSRAYLTGLAFKGVSQNLCEGVNFDYACLVNADFTGTALNVSPNGESVHMNKACLQGAVFTDALLDGADLSAAAVDENPGKITVTIQDGWPAGKTQQLPITYSGTAGIEKATDHTTICPAGTLGPCVGTALVSPDAPKSWPVTTPKPRGDL